MTTFQLSYMNEHVGLMPTVCIKHHNVSIIVKTHPHSSHSSRRQLHSTHVSSEYLGALGTKPTVPIQLNTGHRDAHRHSSRHSGTCIGWGAFHEQPSIWILAKRTGIIIIIITLKER